MLSRFTKRLLHKPGLLLLIIILIIISMATLKSGFYLAGWDNYSSYFNLKTDIWRTLFATWREYRGFGTPSDAEVTDIFRQLFYLSLVWIVPEQLLDQLYYIFSLCAGILSMYVFSKLLMNELFPGEKLAERKKDIFATVTSLFYLFNLNTLSVFYSPIIPFTNRFYSLPLTLFAFAKFIKTKSPKTLFFLIAVIIVTSGSYITPTVLITSLIGFFIFLFFRFSIKKTVVYSTIFLLLNSFWILPFLNYTKQKSNLIPLARTFIEINESTLNRPSTEFSLEKQSILYPSFLDINYASINGKDFTLHPLLVEYGKLKGRIIFLFFPVLYLIGGFLIFFNKGKNKKNYWIPIWIFLFLFLSSKEYSPLGFVYIALKKFIPFFEILFRIQDTKFHAYISFAGSISAAFALFYFSFLLKKSINKLTLVLIILIGLNYFWLFRTYFNGNLIGFYAYTKIPKAYFEIAKMINDQSGKGRILHLPMLDWHHYWRAFNWGYLGSSFFNYLINKPYIDPTFEPASMENAYLHKKINTLAELFYRSSEYLEKEQIAGKFLQLLRKTGIEYVMVDESISATIFTRNMYYYPKQITVEAKQLFNYLKSTNQISLLGSYNIALNELYPVYKNLYPATVTGLSDKLPQSSQIELYQIKSVLPVFSLVSEAENVDSNLENLLETDVVTENSHSIQNENAPMVIYPFQQQNHGFTRNQESFSLKYPVRIKENQFLINTPVSENDSYLVDIYAYLDKNKLNLKFYYRYYPDINGSKFQKYLGELSFEIPANSITTDSDSLLVSNWSYENAREIYDSFRLKINDLVLSVPVHLSERSAYLYSILLHEKSLKVSVLTKSSVENLNLESFRPTDPPLCYGEEVENYEGAAEIDVNNYLRINSKNGAYCLRAPVDFQINLKEKKLYLEVELFLNAETNDLKTKNKAKSLVDKVLLKEGKKIVPGYVCIREGQIDDCLNSHRHLNIGQGTSGFRFPLRRIISNKVETNILIGAIPTQGQSEILTVEQVRQHYYDLSTEKTLSFNSVFIEKPIFLSGNLTLSFPKPISPYSYFHKPGRELFDMSTEMCKTSVRTIRFIGDVLINDADNCSTYFAQKFRYAFTSPYLFAYEYWFGSGQQPYIVMGRKNDNLLFERSSLYQGYPHLPGIGNFQDPRLFNSYTQVKKDLESIKLISGSRLIDPRSSSDTYSKDMAIHLFQDTANEGIMGIRSFDMIEYPISWNKLSLVPVSGARSSYEVAGKEISYSQALPSLWKVKGVPQNSLLIFTQGFDKQWGIYNSIWGVLFGKSLAKNYRCDGYANCFEITKSICHPELVSGSQSNCSFYVFYWPERLNAIGWGITFLTAALLIFNLRKSNAKEFSA